jgi:uncharacterized protein
MGRARDPVDIGVIADTHGLLRPEACRALRGVSLIIHAGDVGAVEVLDGLRAIAPVTAVRGNNDRGAWARTLPARARLEVAGARILVVHDVRLLPRDVAALGVQLVIAGHSHRPMTGERDGVLFLNPGSAGPRRFTLPVSVARLRVRDGHPRARLVALAV